VPTFTIILHRPILFFITNFRYFIIKTELKMNCQLVIQTAMIIQQKKAEKTVTNILIKKDFNIKLFVTIHAEFFYPILRVVTK